MNRFVLLRLLRVGLGFALAVIVGSAIVLVFGFNNGRLPEPSLGALALWAVTLGLISAYAAQFAMPALIVVLLGEVLRWRFLWFCLSLGFATAVGAHRYFLAEELELNSYPLASTIIAGLAAGIVYWFVAGRSAGLDRIERTDP